MGEREKGHRWTAYDQLPSGPSDAPCPRCCECGWDHDHTLGASCKEQHAAHIASLEAQPEPVTHYVENGTVSEFSDVQHFEEVAAHSSAGQSDASLSDIDPTVLLHAAGLKHLYDKLVESRKESAELRKELIAANEQIEEFDTRLAESRAAMREEAASALDKRTNRNGRGGLGEMFANTQNQEARECAELIRSLPADSSALDARDARVRYEALKEAAKVLDDEVFRHRQQIRSVRPSPKHDFCDDYGCFTLEELAKDIIALTQRSAEKGKAGVKYECGCPPRFRVDPKEGKQYEAYCSQHHKPLRRSAEKGKGE